MPTPRWMIYGATGYTGELVAEEALRRGHRPILAGRSPEKLKPLADRLGLEWKAIDLRDAQALIHALDGLALVFHAAGPFVDTSDPMIRACLAAGVSYVDITGEIPVFQNTFSHNEEARQKGIVLMSGVGFDVVPTDCLARYVAEKVPGATDLEIAIAAIGQPSAGTAKSSFDAILRGGLVRRHGELVPMPMGKGGRRVRFSDRERPVLPIPWGDLETAYRTTRIPNITTYMSFPANVATALRTTWPLQAVTMPVMRSVFGSPAIKRAIVTSIETRVKGPDEMARKSGHSYVWARAAGGGREAQAWLETSEGYAFTAVAGVRSVERIFELRPKGAVTPALAFGADFVLEIEGTRRADRLPEGGRRIEVVASP